MDSTCQNKKFKKKIKLNKYINKRFNFVYFLTGKWYNFVYYLKGNVCFC